ncbi:hypothetical protein [Streptomyces sp. NPDC056231]|uniref:hypothetical protein n=1 Tax=Streptomyces sp. NPDC056231 TaxID=3345755 RepID=UPI003AACED06
MTTPPGAVRQLIESVDDTLKGRLDLEQHGGRTTEGVAVRVTQRVLALATANERARAELFSPCSPRWTAHRVSRPLISHGPQADQVQWRQRATYVRLIA